MDAKSFRFQYDETVKLLGIPVTVEYVDSEGFIQRKDVTALIDTGATYCCIDKKLAKQWQFTTIGVTKTRTAAGVVPNNIHTVNIVLPENIRFDNEEIMEVDAGVDFVIGMNLLKKGDFMLSHYDGTIIFSFRMPPVNDGSTYGTDSELKVSLGVAI